MLIANLSGLYFNFFPDSYRITPHAGKYFYVLWGEISQISVENIHRGAIHQAGLCFEFLVTVASDAQACIFEVPSGALLGGVLAQNGTGTTIVQSDGTDTKLTVNDNVEPGTHLQFRCVDNTNWVVSGVVLSSDADPAFS